MKRVLSRLLIAVSMFAACQIAMGQSQASPGQLADSKQEKKIKLQVYFMGYFYVPEGFKAYKTKSWIDAWFGYVVSPDGAFRIRYSAGMVEAPFRDGKTGYQWIKSESRGKVELKYGLRRVEQEEEIAAELPGLNFYAAVTSQHDIDLFLEIVRSYKVGRCPDCERAVPEPAIQQALGADSPVSGL